jgi:hypothetical protein
MDNYCIHFYRFPIVILKYLHVSMCVRVRACVRACVCKKDRERERKGKGTFVSYEIVSVMKIKFNWLY